MKIRSDIHAGDGGSGALRDCQAKRDYWKAMAYQMEMLAKSPSQPSYGQPPVSSQPPAYGQTQPPAPAGGGWVGSIWFPDMSGVCG